MTNKPREFWLVTFSSGKIQLSENEVTFETEYYSPGDSRPTKPQGIMKVVEAQAYQVLLEQAERMVSYMNWSLKYESSEGAKVNREVRDQFELLLKQWKEFKK